MGIEEEFVGRPANALLSVHLCPLCQTPFEPSEHGSTHNFLLLSSMPFIHSLLRPFLQASGKNNLMSNSPTLYAPGWPGIPPRWTSSAKIGIGTALNQHSKVWFTMSHGILNEIYFPRVDQACTRDMGFIVTDGQG